MTKRERIRAAVTGGTPDRLPYGFWTHLPGIDLDPVRLSEETYSFYKAYDLDFIKTMNNGMYPIEDFGCTIDYSQIPLGGVAKVTSTPIHSAADFKKLEPCSIEKGSLARELRGLDLLMEKLKGEDVPVLFTAFSPLTTANKLSGNTLRKYLDEGEKEAVHYALRVITDTTCALVKEVIRRGADGIFFANQSGTYSFSLSILKSDPVTAVPGNAAVPAGSQPGTLRYTFDYARPVAGTGRYIHTYRGNGNPLPSFEGEPEPVILRGDLETLAASVWESLNGENRISLYVRFTNIEDGSVRTKVINKHA